MASIFKGRNCRERGIMKELSPGPFTRSSLSATAYQLLLPLTLHLRRWWWCCVTSLWSLLVGFDNFDSNDFQIQ
jgi:hypothetical protein